MNNENIGNVDNDMVEESHVHRIKKDAYYVASANGLGLILTTVQLRETEKDNNYAEWARVMRMTLRSKKNAIYGTVRSHMIQQEPMPKLRTILAQICKEEHHKNLTRAGDYTGDGAAFAVASVGAERRGPPSKLYCTYCKKAGHDVAGCFQLVGYPEWWPRSSPQTAGGRGTQQGSYRRWRSGRGSRSGQGGRQQLTARTHIMDRAHPLEAWANSTSVWRGRMAAAENPSSGDRFVGEDDWSGPNSSGPGYFPNLQLTNGQSC
ncbi:hypothetical protein M9H77_11937 [Catharanthus roseus]|uniref:Uncharacterized protein n=1 Tax=Catharanthus roseus TaxID=4058 RepID=A0ACC0BG65_CATRO|nr:hypothetical protein M9H77_11937 [Catharanthus roseus]